MSEQEPAPKPRKRVATGRPPHRWQPGESGNPKGRPRVGTALAERIRERFEPDVVIDLAIKIAADDTVPAERRLAALLPFVQLGYLRPPASAELTLTQGQAPERDFRAMPLAERKALLERLEALPIVTEET